MSAAPAQPRSATTWRRDNHSLLPGGSIVPPVPRASRSFVLAAARLRALHLDPLITGSGMQPAGQPPRTKNGFAS